MRGLHSNKNYLTFFSAYKYNWKNEEWMLDGLGFCMRDFSGKCFAFYFGKKFNYFRSLYIVIRASHLWTGVIKLRFVFNIKKIAAYGLVLHLLEPCIHIHRMIFFIWKQKKPEVLVFYFFGIRKFTKDNEQNWAIKQKGKSHIIS